ncbi:OmpA family protein [Siccirubricoccus phaeus]|uniref:OmpA family protein n=1 Tax=Siccirubricoccus phaeus TaxID=2595053 RepID=UPI00165C48A0|nr:OmpA family protein [Siccirubricoccus phaeus]
MSHRHLPGLLCLLALLAGCRAAGPPAAPAAIPVQAAPVLMPARVPAERRILLTIHFQRDSYEIDDASMRLVANLAAALADERLRGAGFEVNGHTDVSGRLARNLSLSFLRANAVVEQLHARGVRHATIRAQGFGPLQLLTPSEPANPGNRRVEIIALSR